MTAQPDFTNFAASPLPPSGLTRMVGHVKGLAAGSALAMLGFLVLQKALPDGWRPADILGMAAGSGERHEIEERQNAKLAYERGLADATAQAQVKAQADLVTIQKVLDERTQGLTTQSTMAGFADFSCMAAAIVSSLTQPQGWGRQSAGDDVYYASQRIGAATCGKGDIIRQNVTASQIDAIRTAAAARGAPMTNGGVQEVAAPPPLWPGAPRTLEAIYALSQPSRHYDYGDVQKVQKWVASLPSNVQQHLYANLPSNNEGWDVFVDRARAFDALARTN